MIIPRGRERPMGLDSNLPSVSLWWSLFVGFVSSSSPLFPSQFPLFFIFFRITFGCGSFCV